MSTEKDRDIFEMATEQYHEDQLQDQILRVRKAVDYGIQHARQGGRGSLERFYKFYKHHKVKTEVLSDEDFSRMLINKFLEQEKSKA
jgi:hypothetical protein